jgi:hypothetical protein
LGEEVPKEFDGTRSTDGSAVLIVRGDGSLRAIVAFTTRGGIETCGGEVMHCQGEDQSSHCVGQCGIGYEAIQSLRESVITHARLAFKVCQ